MTARESDVARAARRLAHKLGCETITLVGAAREPLVSSLARLPLELYDEQSALDQTSDIAVDLRACAPIPDFAGGDDSGANRLTIVGAEAILDDPALLELVLSASSAVLVADLDGKFPGARGLEHICGRLEAASGRVCRAELVGREPPGPAHCDQPLIALDPADSGPVDFLVSGGLDGLRLDPSCDQTAQGRGPARVCILSFEVVGPSKNGGIGTANTSLAIALAQADNDVTLIYAGVAPEDDARWRAHYAALGVDYRSLDADALDAIDGPFYNLRAAWAAFELVRQLHENEAFDVIHVPECSGHAYFIGQAKRTGIAFADAQLVLGVHSSTRWCAEANRYAITSDDGLVDERLERGAVRDADVVISPSRYLLGYMRDRDWLMPARTFVQPYITSQTATPPAEPGVTERIREIAFFGRLEKRKGLDLFCDALDLLAVDPEFDAQVTFIGKPVCLDGHTTSERILERAKNWRWDVELHTDFSHQEALDYLAEHRPLTVIPSLVDNSPNTVYETLALELPVIASRSGGTSELIATDNLVAATFTAAREHPDWISPAPPHAHAEQHAPEELAERIRAVVEMPMSRVTPSFDVELNADIHMAWHSTLSAEPRSKEPAERGVEVFTLGTGLVDDRWTESTADVLLFVPPDAELRDGLIEHVARAAALTEADLFTWSARDPETDKVTPSAECPAAVALTHPMFARGGFAIRGEALRSLGGFSPGTSGGECDIDIFVRADMAGLSVTAIPSVGSCLAQNDDERRQPWPRTWAGQVDRLRPFYGQSEALGSMAALYRGALDGGWARNDGLRRRVDALERENAELKSELIARSDDLAVLASSRSWRITKPLRHVGGLKRLAR